MSEVTLLAQELCQLTPLELDALIFELQGRGLQLPYTSELTTSAADALAAAMLDTYSVGDAIALCHRYSGEHHG